VIGIMGFPSIEAGLNQEPEMPFTAYRSSAVPAQGVQRIRKSQDFRPKERVCWP
jgi:hypothetical protein